MHPPILEKLSTLIAADNTFFRGTGRPAFTYKVHDLTQLILHEQKGFVKFRIMPNIEAHERAINQVHAYIISVCTFQDDKTGNVDTGPKQWSSDSHATEESSWLSWIVPMGLALAASLIYRIFFTK